MPKSTLAIVYRRIGKLEQAENRCTQSLSLLNDQNRTQDDPMLLRCMTELSRIYLASDKIQQAESLARNTYRTLETTLWSQQPQEFTKRTSFSGMLRKT